MTPQERQLVDDLFDRLAKLETAPREPEREAAITDGLRRAPNAVYALVQTVLVQDEALKRAEAHIQELEDQLQPQQNQRRVPRQHARYAARTVQSHRAARCRTCGRPIAPARSARSGIRVRLAISLIRVRTWTLVKGNPGGGFGSAAEPVGLAATRSVAAIREVAAGRFSEQRLRQRPV